MNFADWIILVFMGFFLYHSYNHQPACIQLGEYTLGVCRDFYENPLTHP